MMTAQAASVKLANTLLALAPGQLPLVKLADVGLSKDVGQHGAPQSQVRIVFFLFAFCAVFLLVRWRFDSAAVCAEVKGRLVMCRQYAAGAGTWAAAACQAG
jgi:hypothetical protein